MKLCTNCLKKIEYHTLEQRVECQEKLIGKLMELLNVDFQYDRKNKDCRLVRIF